ncbi:MAG: AEC family transporter [Myxococcales bacterium]|nr:AEC family transporter [Myxococcales bacterium]
MNVALEVLRVVVPVFAVAGAGYGYAARGRLDLRSLTDPLFLVFTPALAFTLMVESRLEGALLARLTAAASAVILGSGALTWAVGRLTGARPRGLYLVTMFANNGNLGLPLCALAFGETGLAMATIYCVTGILFHFSLGIALVTPRADRWGVLKLPVLHAIILGLLLGRLEVAVPAPILKGIELLGAPTIPVMLFALGYRLRGSRLHAVRMALVGCAIRIGGGLALAVAATHVFGLTGLAAKVVILQGAMPPAAFNFVLAEMYDADPEMVASAVALGTFASIVTIPGVLAWIL